MTDRVDSVTKTVSTARRHAFTAQRKNARLHDGRASVLGDDFDHIIGVADKRPGRHAMDGATGSSHGAWHLQTCAMHPALKPVKD
jgi:hypothetical protein